ncbi:MAG: FkbM family methyltransferase [Chitinophagaceae bacterium]|nr:FkbM family methyltransferase [Chitinophagaceae bacterium]
MLNYLINSIRRKIARRVKREYPVSIKSLSTPEYGDIQYTIWHNPLVNPTELELSHCWFFKKFLSPGDMAIDIGANVGHMSICMGVVTGKEGLVLSFDPNPVVFKILTKNAELNKELTHIEPHNFAITDKEEEFYYSSSEASFSNGGISKEKNSRHGKYTLDTKIKGVKLEDFLQEKYASKLNRLKLVKIDTEGYDKEIIKSIRGLLEKYKPAVITECFSKNKAEARYEQFNLLRDLGYSLYYFSSFTIDAEIIPIQTQEDMMNWKHFDIYAVQK